MELGKFAIYQTHFGLFKIGYLDDAIIYIKFATAADHSPSEERSALSDRAFEQLQEYFECRRKEFDLPLQMIGTDFQKRVWQALQEIPYGKTCSYKDIATAVGNSKASRAVGMANNRNPISIVVPCHRVIGASGALVGYGGGLERKSSFLDLERNNID